MQTIYSGSEVGRSQSACRFDGSWWSRQKQWVGIFKNRFLDMHSRDQLNHSFEQNVYGFCVHAFIEFWRNDPKKPATWVLSLADSRTDLNFFKGAFLGEEPIWVIFGWNGLRKENAIESGRLLWKKSVWIENYPIGSGHEFDAFERVRSARIYKTCLKSGASPWISW